MRMSPSLLPVLDRRRDALLSEIAASIRDPEATVFVGGPLNVVGRQFGVEERGGPGAVFGIGFAGPIRTEVQAKSLLGHIEENLQEGRSPLSRRLSQRIARFVERKRSASSGPYRSAAREFRGGGGR